MIPNRLRSGIAVLPNAITAMNLALGVYAILAASESEWAVAGWCILAAIALDMMDGRVARWTNSCSSFGVEFDSLSDLVSFGVAPAVLMHHLVLREYGRVGTALSVLFAICAALRLARFNVRAQAQEEALPYFIGLPTPAAGGILASFVILYDIWSAGKNVRTLHIVMKQVPAFFHLLPGIIFVLALLMVSGVRYSSFKKANLLKPRSMRAFLVMIVAALMIYSYPQNTLFVIFVGYISSGLLEYVWRGYKMRSAREKGLHVESPEDDVKWKEHHRGVI